MQQRSPLGQTDWSGNTITTSYDPRLLNDFWAQVDQRQGARDLYGAAAGQAYGMISGPNGDPRAGLSPLTTSVTPGSTQTGFSRGNFLAIPGANDFAGQQQRVEDATYDRFASRADTRFGQQQTALENQLRDMGFVPGTEGYDAALNDFNMGKNDAYQQAAMNAVTAGGSEASRLLADALRIRGTQEGEAQTDLGNFNAGQGQNFAQRIASGQFGNAARGQQFGENQGGARTAQDWLSLAQGGAPQGTMLPNFDLGLQGIDQNAANNNAWMAGLSDLFGPALAGGLGSFLNGANGGNGGGSGLGGLLAGLGNSIFGGNGSGSWLDQFNNPAMDPSLAYGDGSGWGQDIWGNTPTDFASIFGYSDPSWLSDLYG